MRQIPIGLTPVEPFEALPFSKADLDHNLDHNMHRTVPRVP